MQTGLAELLADPSVGPLTIFAPVDDSLKLIPGRMAIAADTEYLLSLLRFHVAIGVADVLPAEASVATEEGRGSNGGGNTRRRPSRRWGTRLFTPSLANATLEERSVLSGERFVSGRPLLTMLGREAAALCVQIATARTNGSGSGPDGEGGEISGNSGITVFVGPGQQQQVGIADGEGAVREIERWGNLFVGAFAAEIVLPDLNAVNGVVHGISGVMTYPWYPRPPAVVVDAER